jgi:uncharacterized membrane protein
MNDVIFARVLHVLAVVVWIGGVSMATTVLLPTVRHGILGEKRLDAFEAIERRFIWQARTAVIVVGLTGLYMTERLGLWDRFRLADFWWMHAMVCVWFLFTFILFVAEPLLLRRHFRLRTTARPEVVLGRMQRAHWILLILSLLTTAAAVAGSQGWSLF